MTDPMIKWDPYDPKLASDPYPTYRRLREEVPLYYNDEYDFYAVSRYEDVKRGLGDRDTFISGKGAVLEFIKSETPIPPGMLIFEDPPLHTIHRGLFNRIFTPKRMNALEGQIRDFCAKALDPLVDGGEFDFVGDLGADMPMRVIGMLLGIPDEGLKSIRESADAHLRTEVGKPMSTSADMFIVSDSFEEYLDWRAKHPSDDVMTELLNAEFVDETGATRTLTREEILLICNLLAAAGNETTGRLIGWTGKVLAEHPDQRREIYNDRGLINQSLEEILRYESPAPFIARYVAKDTEFHGRKIREGSAMVFLCSAANRDEAIFANGEVFDIHRERKPHFSFGYGFHVCLGNPLARVEGRAALDEVLKRFPDWEVDLDNAKLTSTSTVRGWETMPAYIPRVRGSRKRHTSSAESPNEAPAGSEAWHLTLKTGMGPQEMTAHIIRDGNTFSGKIESPMGSETITGGEIEGDILNWSMKVKKPMALTVTFSAKVDGNRMSGTAKLGMFGKADLIGERR